MWIGAYKRGVELAQDDTDFDALIAAAVLRSDTANFARLLVAFPALVAEIQRRYDAPGGALTLEEWIAAHGEPGDDDRRYLERRFAA